MSKIPALLLAFLGFIKTLFGLMEKRKQQQAGVDAQAAEQREQVIATVDKVHEAQVAAEHELVRDPGHVLDDDGFRRD